MISRRRRRSSALLLVAASAAAATGCSTIESSDSAATVDGVDISQQALDQSIAGAALSLAGPADTTGTPATAPANADAALGRALLSIFIQATASRAFLAEHGESIPDDEVAGFDPATAAIPGVPPDVSEAIVGNVEGEARTLLAEFILAGPAWARAGVATAEAAYNESPYDSGAVCLRLLVVDDAETLEEVQAALDAGEPFGDLAREHSIDTTTSESGGVLAGADGTECLAASTITPQSAGELAEIVMTLGAGEHSEPIEQPAPDGGATTWGILQMRPYDEVADQAAALLGPAAFAEHLATAAVDVDPRYGRWDPETSAVVSLSS